MDFNFRALLFAVLIYSSYCEVSNHFAKCRNFFYKGSPPQFTGSNLTDICQYYQNASHFASTYSTKHRIPVFSAYLLPRGTCPGDQPQRKETWFVEPQVSDPTRPPTMAAAGWQKRVVKIKQAINEDYSNTGFDRGHLNPNFYQCGNGRLATFTLTNCVPQNPCFNEQLWKAMEEQSKKVMDDLCAYPCATRYFVTGAVPTEKRIPDRIHDNESDRQRNYSRVSIPSHMWTAACCDTTSCTKADEKNGGFSYGYIGNNTADPNLEVFTVHQLEETLVQRFRYVSEVNFNEIFSNDKCNINEQKSKEAQSKLAVPLARKMTNEVYTMSYSQLSSLPPKKRKQISDEQRTFKTPKLSHVYRNVTLSDAEYGLRLNPQELVKTRTELRKAGLSLVLTARSCSLVPKSSSSHTHTELKRTVEENACNQDWSLYEVVRKQSQDSDVAFDGTFCRHGHKCGKYGKAYKWCYIDWSNNWNYCCENDCDFRGEKYTYCKTGDGWSYCSQRSSMIGITGKRCLQDHQCGLYGYKYYWCYTDVKKNYDYCCQPWDPCRDKKDGYKKWCYTGRSSQTAWQYCV